MSGTVHRADCAHHLQRFIALGPSDARGHDEPAATRKTAYFNAVTHLQAVEVRGRDARAEGSAGGDADRLTEHGELTPRRINGRNRPNDAVLHVDAIGRALAALSILATAYQSDLADRECGLRNRVVILGQAGGGDVIAHPVDEHAAEGRDRSHS